MGRLNKVEISGVNTAELPVLSREQAKDLFRQARAGSQQARQDLIQGMEVVDNASDENNENTRRKATVVPIKIEYV